MGTYELSRIYPSDKKGIAQLDKLLQKEGIERDKNLEYTVGLFDDDFHLAATGSCFMNTLRCLAVDDAHQGEGLLNEILTHLIDYQYRRGYLDLFLYTKCNTVKFFSDLGFYEIARVENQVVFMENRRDGFSSYLSELEKKKRAGTNIGAIIVNANPFTLGHQYLLEKAAAENDVLHIFVVSEDVSLVPFETRYHLVKEGTKHLTNLVYHQTGNYMISNATFPSYFLKDEDKVIEAHARLDIQVFKKIAGILGITRRYVGEEPFSRVTNIYNRIMQEELQAAMLDCIIIPRKEDAGKAISASNVRQLIHDGDFDKLKQLVPKTTYDFFTSEKSKDIVEQIRSSSDIIHY